MSTNRRAQLSAHYNRSGVHLPVPVQITASAADGYRYRGEWSGLGIVARVDLNSYSGWARTQTLSRRVGLLDEFFTAVVPELERHGGVYYRDEGDCIVGVFSDYFGHFALENVLAYCKKVVGRTYGQGLTAKASVAMGSETAFFQKKHEVGTDDWSAEGQVFVDAARLEQAVPSKPRIYFFTEEYNLGLGNKAPVASKGGKYYWTIQAEKLQVPGLARSGGWADLTFYEHIPGGRIQL